MNRLTRQAGFTLIELMVAMVIGLLISMAAMQLLATNQRTFAVQQALSTLHEDGQMVIRYITADLRQAGRGSALMGTIPPVVFDQGTDPHAVDGAVNDELVVNYFATSDCQGVTSAAEEEVINHYFVAQGALMCSGNRSAGAVLMLPNVESFQVQYGIDTDPANGLGVTQYVDAGDQGSNPVVAIRFALLLSSGTDMVSTLTQERTYYVLGEPIKPPVDRSLRRVFTSTVQLRNYDWESVGRLPDET